MATNQLRGVFQTLRRNTLPHEGAGQTDGQLLESYVRGREEAAFAALVYRHGPMVWGVCRRVLASHQDAEDAFQATFLVLVRKAASVMPRELVANWLYGVAHQTALKARATTARRRGKEKQVTAMPEPAESPRDLWDDLRPLLDQELSRLPDKYLAVVVLCDLGGKTRKEAARQLHLPEGTVASRLATARALLARRLRRSGLGVSGGALAAVLAQNAASAGVPAAVASRTIRAASLFAAGQAAAGVISGKAAALAEGVLKTMLLTRLKILAGVLVVVAVLGAGAAALTQSVRADRPADPPAPQQQVRADKPAEAPAKERKEAEALPGNVSGVVKAVDAAANSLTVARREGETTFSVAKGATINIDGKPSVLAGLPAGAIVTLSQFVDPRTARSVQASGRSYFGAPVKAVDTAKNTITIKMNRNDALDNAVIDAAKNLPPTPAQEGERTYAVARDASITVDGKHCPLAAVPPGALVNLGLAADQTTACNLQAEGPCLGDCGGSRVQAVDAEKRTLTFDDKAPAAIAGKTFTVAEGAIILLDGKSGKLAEVPAGAYVNLILSVDRQKATRVHVHGPPFLGDCGGSQVKAVDVAERTITFDEKARAEVAGKTFRVAEDADIHIDNKRSQLSELPAGAYVSLRLALDGQTARSVHAQGPNVCDGCGSMVQAVDVAKRTITFTDKARAEVAGKTFPVARDASVVIDGRPGELAEIPTGALVLMRLSVDRQTARHLHAQGPSLSGVVNAVDAANNTVTINGISYPLAKDAVVVIDGQRAALAGLRTGAGVNVNLHVDQRTVGLIQTK
jgi:RNA polymerase sigma factor (sigma-70 family)